MLVCGIDDAGRGSMLGPLVISGVVMDKKNLKKLSALGVRDSKKLSPAKRELLYPKIIGLADGHYTARIPPRSVDAAVRSHGLNRLEAKYMARVVSRLGPDTSYVDSCDVNPRRFGQEISGMSGNRTIRSYHRADSRFVIVSAASIIAKVSRDRSVARLRKYHDLGSGYPSDPRAVGFVRSYYDSYGTLPAFVRKSWKPVQRIMAGA